jgi:hypothetical protein
VNIGLNGAQRTIELIGILVHYVVYVSNVPVIRYDGQLPR